MDPQIVRLRERVAQSYETMSRALTAAEEADPHAPGYDGEALTRAFTDARSAHAKACEALENREAVLEARANLPVNPLPDGPYEFGGSLSVGDTRDLEYREGGRHNYFADLAARKEGDSAAAERLTAHGRQVNDLRHPEVAKRLAKGGMESRAINTTDGTGGELVPPLWLTDRWVPLQRAGRPIANTLNMLPLPPETDNINLPAVATGATVAIQTDGGSVSSTDITTGAVTAAVQTIAGQQDTSIQLRDLSAPGVDVVIFDDLARAYAALLDQKVISGSATNAKGLDAVSGINGVTYTQATPTTATLYPKLADGYNQVCTGRFLPPSVIGLHPRRWASILASLDTANRPLVVPRDSAAFNPVGTFEDVAAEAIVGTMFGVPIVIDSQIPTTLGAGTNQDEIILYRAEDVYLWESAPRLRVFEDVLSGTLEVRFQIYGYYAIAAGRYVSAISLITGTGLVAPTF